MRHIISRLREGSSWAGLAAALGGFNLSQVAELGSHTWWTSVVVVVGGIVAAVIKDR